MEKLTQELIDRQADQMTTSLDHLTVRPQADAARSSGMSLEGGCIKKSGSFTGGASSGGSRGGEETNLINLKKIKLLL